MAQLPVIVEYTDCISAKGKNPPPCDIKQSHGEVPVMLELWGMQTTPSLPSLPSELWLGEVAPDKVLSMGRIKLFHIWTVCKQKIYAKLIYWI